MLCWARLKDVSLDWAVNPLFNTTEDREQKSSKRKIPAYTKQSVVGMLIQTSDFICKQPLKRLISK